MLNFKFCVTSDLHIRQDGRIFKTRAKPFGDLPYSLEQISQYLNDNSDIKLLILSGDIFDYRNLDSSSLHIFDSFLASLKHIETILYVQGQHDFSNPPWPDVIRDSRLHHLNMDSPFVYNDVYFYGSDYTGRPDELIPKCSTFVQSSYPIVLVLHETWKFTDNFPFFSEGAQLSENLKLLISGDIHGHELSVLPNGGLFLSPGCIAPNTIAEDFIKYFHIIRYSNDTGKFEVQPIPLKTRPIYKFELKSEEDVKRVLNINFDTGLPNDLAHPLIVVYCSSGSLFVEFRSRFKQPYVFYKTLKNSQESSSDASVNVRDAYNIRHFFMQYFEDTGDVAGLLYDSIGKSDKISLYSAIKALYKYWEKSYGNGITKN